MICTSCKIDKNEEEFVARSSEKYRTGKRRTKCKTCVNDLQRTRYEKYKKDSYFKYKVTRARSRACSLKVPFDLDEKYLESIWTEVCPVTENPFVMNASRSDENAAELDRFNPDLGYVKGNVTFLSRKINRLKNNASIEELTRLLEWMKDFDK